MFIGLSLDMTMRLNDVIIYYIVFLYVLDEWLSDCDVFVRQCGVPEGERAVVLVDYLSGCAKEEELCHTDEVRRDFGSWCLCCGECFARERPWRRCMLSYIRGCCLWLILLLNIAELSFGCISA